MKALTREECYQLLSTNYIGRIGYISRGSPEIIPITYYYDKQQEAVISYSSEGNKITAMRKNPNISFQVDEIKSLTNWKSILILGKFQELSRSDAKVTLHHFSQGVKRVIREKEHLNLTYLKEFSSKVESPNDLIVYRINIGSIRGKKRMEENQQETPEHFSFQKA